jgi:predicted phosphodiesterase
VHYADRSSRVHSLRQMRPLFDGATSLVLNGDTLDTRTGKNPARTREKRREVLEHFGSAGVPVTFLTGNHDPDLSEEHALELEGGRILVTHGDVLFDTIVPWSHDAGMIEGKVVAALAAIPNEESGTLESRLRAFRSVSAAIPQRHQSEPNLLRYCVRFANDTIWPPWRALSILRAWREAPGLAEAVARRHRPKAGFVLIGHTHKPGIWRMKSGLVVINTGSFCAPFGAFAADIGPGMLRVRRVQFKAGEFHPGPSVAEFPLS